MKTVFVPNLDKLSLVFEILNKNTDSLHKNKHAECVVSVLI